MADETKPKMGRPTKLTKELATDIFVWVAEGKSLRAYCRQEGAPSKTAVLRWAGENKDFRDQYAKARDFQVESYVDEMIDIADHDCQLPVLIEGEPLIIDDKPVMTVTPAGVSHSKLRIEARRWYAERMKAKKYGNKQDITVDLPEGAGVLKTPPVLSTEDWIKLSKQANRELEQKEKEFNQSND